ncbi:hypothetical protein FJZ39_03950 [Candidatus Saccharibacteria bacterium]|nr:hypothetical protein [Candidatus Saccharibacteria bacterium]
MKQLWQLGNILSLIFALVANFLVGAQILGLPSINQISDKYATLLTPAGYAFSIWSLIYVFLIVFVIYQARDIVKPRQENNLPRLVGPFFIIASICNGLWTYVFVNEMVGLSVFVLLLLAGSLYALLWRLKIAITDPPIKTILCVWWPLMIYTGWVTVASLVNAASWLESLNITLTPTIASIVLIVFAIILLILLIKRNVRELLLACIWGIVAIGVQQMQLLGSQRVVITAFTVAGLLLIAVGVHAYINRKSNLLARLSKGR